MHGSLSTEAMQLITENVQTYLGPNPTVYYLAYNYKGQAEYTRVPVHTESTSLTILIEHLYNTLKCNILNIKW